MDVIRIQGPGRLEGTVHASGAKNAALPILASTILAKGPCVLKNVPQVSDVSNMVRILKSLGAKVSWNERALTIDSTPINRNVADYRHVSTMRASICLLGPLLSKFGEARVSLPGGCVIGPRPVDLHLKGLQALGGKVALDHGYVVVSSKGLRGGRVYLGGSFGSSVLATANVIMAAVLARGRTEIINAACEPEVTHWG
ncbi:MAG: UDP-N-acetylglucosamine 1-carboxyvinyltransferase, partial [Candidatus Omnitrophica bacterium]|nr:UDP-N-acetylglucosamine 1-carboxyvinyltransferase [Candidatus Omnitrophota bacterium]